MAEIIRLENGKRYKELKEEIQWGTKCIQAYALVKGIINSKPREHQGYNRYQRVIEDLRELIELERAGVQQKKTLLRELTNIQTPETDMGGQR